MSVQDMIYHGDRFLTDMSVVQTAILEALDQRQAEERNVIIDIIQTSQNSAAIVREAKKMTTQVTIIVSTLL